MKTLNFVCYQNRCFSLMIIPYLYIYSYWWLTKINATVICNATVHNDGLFRIYLFTLTFVRGKRSKIKFVAVYETGFILFIYSFFYCFLFSFLFFYFFPYELTLSNSGTEYEVNLYSESVTDLIFNLLTFNLTGGNWQKWKRVFLTCPCHKIYRDEAVGLKSCKNTWKLTIFVKNVKFDILSITA